MYFALLLGVPIGGAMYMFADFIRNKRGLQQPHYTAEEAAMEKRADYRLWKGVQDWGFRISALSIIGLCLLVYMDAAFASPIS